MFSCEKERIVELKSQPPSWINHKGFKFESKIFFSNYTDGENLYFYGPGFFSILDKKKVVISYLMSFTTYPYGKKIPINSFVTVGLASDASIFLFQTLHMGRSGRSVELKDYLKDFNSLPKSNFFDTRKTMVINSRNQLLLPFKDGAYRDKLVLFDLDYSMPVQIIKFKLIDLPFSISDRGIYFVDSIGEDFIVSSSSSTYKIKSDGTYSKIYNQPTFQLFTYKNKIYCVGFYKSMIVSSDGGLTWSEFKGVPLEWRSGIMMEMGDSLVFNSRSRFFTVRIKETGDFSLRELKNDGIELEQVTTITEFNDSIYATTYSGVYYKSKKDFFTSQIKK